MMKKLFKNKSYTLLFQGSLVSAIGTSLYSFAAGFYVQDMFGKDGGAVYLSLFLAVSIGVQVIVSPFAGAWVDKLNKVRIIYITDFIRGALFFLTLFVLTLNLTPTLIIGFLLAVTAIASLNQAFFGPAVTAVLPDIVGEEMLQAANGANSIIGSTQTILGVIAGMFLYEFLGFEAAIMINAISFVFSGFSEMFIRTKSEVNETLIDERLYEDEEKPRFRDDIIFGFKYLKSRDGLLVMMIFSLFLNFAFTPFFSIGFPYLFRTELSRSTFDLGASQIVFSIAMLVAGIIVGGYAFKSLRQTVKKGLLGMTITFIYIVVIVFMITYGYISYFTFYILFMIGNIFMAATMIITNVPLNTAMVKVIEPSVRGRVFSTLGAMSQGLMPVSLIIGGFIVNEYNVATLGIFCSVVLLFPTVGILLSKQVLRFFDLLDNVEKEEIGPVTA